MKIENIIYDIKHLLDALTDDTRINDAHLIFKINNYWAIFLKDEIEKTGIINESYFSRFPLITTNPVSSADDPNVIGGTVKFSKFKMPAIMNIPNTFGLPVRLYTAERHNRIYEITRDYLFEMLHSEDDTIDLYKYFFREGNEVYIYPVVHKVSLLALLQNPLEASVYYTTPELLFQLENGIEYVVTSGSVKDSNNTLYLKNETFTCDSSLSYTGDGVVYRVNQVLDADKDSDYPIPPDIAQRIVLEILTKDYMLEKQNIFDIVNDSQDQFKIMKKQ